MKFQTPYTAEELTQRLARVRHVALDMDGTIYMGSKLFPWTHKFLADLESNGIGYSFLTNNPSKSVDDYLAALATMGIGLADHIIVADDDFVSMAASGMLL